MYQMPLMCLAAILLLAAIFYIYIYAFRRHFYPKRLADKINKFKINFVYLLVIHVIIKLSVFDLHVHSYCTRKWQMLCFLAYLINTTVATDSPVSDGPKRSWSFCLSWGALLTSHLGCGED